MKNDNKPETLSWNVLKLQWNELCSHEDIVIKMGIAATKRRR